jgi:protein phosphatase
MLPSTTTESGYLDIVGDVHGCLDELLELMGALGYRVERREAEFTVTPPAGRKLAFVGDLVNRGPSTVGVLRLAMEMERTGQAFFVSGNHDLRLLNALTNYFAMRSSDLVQSLEQIEKEPEEFRTRVVEFLGGLASYALFDGGKLAIAHAGLKEWMQGRNSVEVSEFALHGETTGRKDEYGVPIRRNWAAGYRGRTLVVYGHTPCAEPRWLNNTIDIDTGCVYGGRLTALRYPERETVSVLAGEIYYKSRRRSLVNEMLAVQAEEA